MGHVPVADREAAYRRVATWLRPGGWWCASLPTGDDPGEMVEDGWLGAPMFFASMPWAEERELLDDRRARIDPRRSASDDEDGRPVPFRWVFAHRSVRPSIRSHRCSIAARTSTTSCTAG